MATVIVGDGGHGRDIASWTRLATVHHHRNVSPRDTVIIGINDPEIRYHVAELLRLNPIANAVIHPSAYVGDPGNYLSGGVVVGPLSSLVTGVGLARHVHVGAGCHLTRCIVGAYTTIGPGATICGDVEIGERVLIGAGATVRNFVKIGEGAVIGAGAVVVRDVRDYATVKGVPAK